jgi:hypothetical protein
MATALTEAPQRSSSRVLVARVLMGIATISAAVATVTDIPAVLDAPQPTVVVQLWRLLGFATFAGLFALLTIRPRRSRGLWEIVIANKLALTVAAIFFVGQGDGAEAESSLTWDGLLVVLLTASYLLVEGWRKRPGRGT